MKSWKYEKDASTGEVFAVYHSVPIFKEHTGSDGTKYTQELLEDIADNNNDRIEETGDYCPIVGWHTPSDNDPSKDPPIIGFAENFRVEKFGKKNPKWCIYATFKIRKDKHDYFRDHPRRSVEIWPEDKPENRYIDPIAVLGAETPRQDLGLVYSKSAAGEESYMYSSVAGGGNTYVPGEVQKNEKEKILLTHDDLGTGDFSHGHKWGHRGNAAARRRYAAPGARKFNEPHAPTAELAKKYIEENKKLIGDTHTPRKITKIDPEISKKIAQHYIEGKNDPENPEVIKAYKAMADEALMQMKTLVDAGYKVEMYTGGADPYRNSQEMVDDLNENKHLWVFPTEDGFGESRITDEDRRVKPMLKDSGYEDINGKPMLVNDVFRAVHDFFGHSELGNSFGPVGEENAWQIHSRMFSPEARKAMTTGTRGQNSWVNFGPHIVREDGSVPKKGDEDYTPPSERPFAEQKLFLMPDDVIFASDDHHGESMEYSKDESSEDADRNFLSGLATGAARAAGGVAKAGTKTAGKAPKATAAAPKAVPKATPSPSVKTSTTSSPKKKVDIAKEVRRRTVQAQQAGVGQRQGDSRVSQVQATSPRMQAPSPAVVTGYSKDDSSKYAGPLAAVPLALGVAAGAAGMAGASQSYAKRKGPRPVRKPRRKSGFNFDKDDKSADVPRLDDVLDGAEEMALDQQDIQQIVEGLRPTIIDIVQQEIASIVAGEDMGPEDSLEEREEVDVIPDEELEDILEGKPDDEVLMGQDDEPDEDEDDDKDEPERNAKDEEDDAEKKAKCEYGKEMFAKMAEKHRLYEKDADHKGASQYMASMDNADRNAMTMYMKSEKAESHEKEAYAKCGEYGKDMKDSYSKDSEVAEADKYRKELSSQADKYSKLQQQYSKLQSELVEAKDQLTEVRRSERYHKIADRLANLEAEGYSFDKEKELEFCMQLSDEMREEHLAERIPQQYAKCPVGAPIPVEESEKLQPIEQKSIKYSRAANHATQKLRAQGHKGVSFEKVLKHMCDNDTDECPSVEDLK